MDIPAKDNRKESKGKAVDAVIDPGVVLGDPLATPPATASATPASDAASDSASDSQATKDDQAITPDSTVLEDGGSIVPNATVTTNDRSAVGEFKPTPPEPVEEEFVEPESIIDPALRPSDNPLGQSEPKSEPEPESEPEPIVPPASEPATQPNPTPVVPDSATPSITPPAPVEPNDPEKAKFIKTYTAEFEESMHRATDAVQKILDAIDTTINEHAPDIKIPEEANEFLEKKPTDGKVEKFEDAREIIRTIMTHATESKQQSEAAATEAAKVYDEVQQFKRDTKQQIAQLTEEK